MAKQPIQGVLRMCDLEWIRRRRRLALQLMHEPLCPHANKVIPNIFEGAWVVSSAVGNTPALLGNKLKQSYFKGDGYFELDCDVGSSSVASWLVHLIQSYSTQLKIDLAFTIQGNDEAELPEKICGALRLCHLDIDAIPFVV